MLLKQSGIVVRDTSPGSPASIWFLSGLTAATRPHLFGDLASVRVGWGVCLAWSFCYFLARLQLGMLQSGMLGLVGFSFAPGKASLLEPGLSWSIWLRYNGYYCTCTLHLLIDLQVGHSFGCAAGAEVLLCEHCWSQVAWRLSHDVTAIPRYYFAASAVASESDHMAAKALKTWLEGCPVPWHVCC